MQPAIARRSSRRCHRLNYDIAFVDINMMTKIGGLDLVRGIRALMQKNTVVTLSQYGAITKVVEAMKLGAVDFVEKPIDPRKIQTAYAMRFFDATH